MIASLHRFQAALELQLIMHSHPRLPQTLRFGLWLRLFDECASRMQNALKPAPITTSRCQPPAITVFSGATNSTQPRNLRTFSSLQAASRLWVTPFTPLLPINLPCQWSPQALPQMRTHHSLHRRRDSQHATILMQLYQISLHQLHHQRPEKITMSIMIAASLHQKVSRLMALRQMAPLQHAFFWCCLVCM